MTRRHLTLIPGGKCKTEDQAAVRLYPYARRVVRAEPKPVPVPRPPFDGPRAA